MLIMSEPWAEPSDPPLPPDQSIPFDWSRGCRLIASATKLF